jgi:hypothetical protein
MFHPAYPTAADLSREAAATDRDLADLVALRELRAIVANAAWDTTLLSRKRSPCTT